LPDRIVQIDIDPAEIGRNYRVEAGVVGDARAALVALEIELDRLGHRPIPWRDDEVAKTLTRIAEAVGTPIEIEVLDQIRAALSPDSLVFNDPTTIAFWARSHWRTDRPRTWFVPSGFGTLGFALPAAIGARLARPDTPTVAIIGDAGIMFTIQDLMTAVQENVPVIVVVFNDEGYGVERRHQDHLYGRRSGVDVMPPDFVALARAFGARGILVDDLSRVGEAVAQTRTDLIAAAREVFLRRGFQRATLEEIAQEAGYTKGAVYSNFEDKDALYLAVLDAHYERRIEAYAGIMLEGNDFEEAVRQVSRFMAEADVKEPGWLPLLSEFVAHAAHDDAVRVGYLETRNRFLRAIADMLDAAQERYSKRFRVPTFEAARASSALIRAMSAERRIDPEGTSPELFVELHASMMLGLVAEDDAGT
jgi:AcrR family transcriptional regulator